MKALFTLLVIVALSHSANAQTSASRIEVTVLSMSAEEAKVEIPGQHTFSVGSKAALACNKTSMVVIVQNVSGTTITLVPLVPGGILAVPYSVGEIMTIECLGRF